MCAAGFCGALAAAALAAGFTADLDADLAAVLAFFWAEVFGITFFAVRDFATATRARAALALVFEPRLVAAAFLLLAVFAVLLERALLLDTTCAWNRHAPVHGLFRGLLSCPATQKGGGH